VCAAKSKSFCLTTDFGRMKEEDEDESRLGSDHPSSFILQVPDASNTPMLRYRLLSACWMLMAGLAMAMNDDVYANGPGPRPPPRRRADQLSNDVAPILKENCYGLPRRQRRARASSDMTTYEKFRNGGDKDTRSRPASGRIATSSNVLKRQGRIAPGRQGKRGAGCHRRKIAIIQQ